MKPIERWRCGGCPLGEVWVYRLVDEDDVERFDVLAGNTLLGTYTNRAAMAWAVRGFVPMAGACGLVEQLEPEAPPPWPLPVAPPWSTT